MKEATLIYPHQLYSPHPASTKNRLHVLVEDARFFDDHHNKVKFHKQKLVLHRASMKYYEREVLKKQGMQVEYVDFGDAARFFELLTKYKEEGLESIHVVDPTDHVLEAQLRHMCDAHDLGLMIYETPNFLTPKIEVERFFAGQRHYSASEFYINQRKRLRILMGSKGMPAGGSWTFNGDKGRLPGRLKIPSIKRFRSNAYVEEARRYVESKFSDHPGLVDEFIYPINEDEAKAWFDNFLEKRFADFSAQGRWIVDGERFAFHSLLSAPLNIGLLSPQYILERVDRFIRTHRIPLESIEILVRQIIGSREFTRAAYLSIGERQRAINFFLHNRRLSSMWYGTNSAIFPLDRALAKVMTCAYCSNSERLMVLGNLMLMSEVHPDDVFRWFMTMFIDAYDWSMVPNVYGVSQFADGGLIIKTPQFFPASEVLKISNYDCADWCDTWDGLFWRFVDRHRVLFSRNEVLSKYTHKLGQMTKRDRKDFFAAADAFTSKATR